ncbi:unnamed protein product [Penicillium pancosmium]
MHFNIPSVSLLLASLAAAETLSTTTSPSASASASIIPTSAPYSSALSSRVSTTPSQSWSSIAAAGSSQAASGELNPDDFDCIYKNYGCDWTKSEYGYGADYCGSSPYKAGQKLSDGGVILAVSKDGGGDCESKAGSQCCTVLANDPCKRDNRDDMMEVYDLVFLLASSRCV